MAILRNFPPVKQDTLEVAGLDWECAPCGQSRDSDPLTRANFDALCDRFDAVDPYGNDWEIVRFGHWGVGWVEQIFVRPGSKCHEMCAEVRAQMANYPCLNEELWVEYDEAESAQKVSSAG